MIFSQTMELEVNLHNKTFICLIFLNFRIPWQFKFIFVYLFFQNDIFEIEKHLKKKHLYECSDAPHGGKTVKLGDSYGWQFDREIVE